MTLADLISELGAPGKGAPAAVRWMSDWLPDAEHLPLDRHTMERLDAWRGHPEDLHELLPPVLPLARPVWAEVPITAQGGTHMILGYGAVPAGDDAIDIAWACYSPDHQRIIGPLGPARVSAAGIARPEGVTDEAWRELRAAAGIIIRLLVLGRHKRKEHGK